MAGRIPQEFFDQLLSRIDIVELIDSRVTLRKKGRNFSACCPFHNEKTPSFSVSQEKQFYHCFGCGAHGNAIGFLMEYERMDFLEAVTELAQSVNMEIPRANAGFATPTSATTGNQSDTYAILQQADRFYRRQLRDSPKRDKAIGYLRQRGLNGETAQKFGIGYAPSGWENLINALAQQGITSAALVSAGLAVEKENGGAYDRFRDRIMFPIRDQRGRTIAFGGRAFDDAMPKYLNSPETTVFRKGRELYGLFEARRNTRRLQRLLVVEGYMDVVALSQHDIPYAVATLGTATTAEHAERLFRNSSEVVFCYDGDPAGREAAWRAVESILPMLRDGRQARFLFLPDGEDPDSLIHQEGKAGFEERLQQAQPLSTYFFQRIIADTDTASLEARSHLYELAKPLLEKLPESHFKEQMFSELGRYTRTRTVPGLSASSRRSQKNLSMPAHNQTAKRRYFSLQEKIIALLFYRPELAQQAGRIDAFHDIPELALLVELIELLRDHPHITVASVLERYRGSDNAELLNELAAWQPQSTAISPEVEFDDALRRLHQESAKRVFDKTLKSSLQELSNEEREMLRNLGKTQSY